MEDCAPWEQRHSTAPVATINEDEEMEEAEDGVDENRASNASLEAYEAAVAKLSHELAAARARCFEIETEVKRRMRPRDVCAPK